MQINYNLEERERLFEFCVSTLKDTRRLYTYSLVHEDTAHFAFNAFAIAIHGSILEATQRLWRTASIHTLGVLAGSCSKLWVCVAKPLECSEYDLCVKGASAGFYAIIGGFGGYVVHNYNNRTSDSGAIWYVAYIAMGSMAIISDLAWSLGLKVSDIAYEAHISGFIVGLLSSLMVCKSPEQSIKYHIYVRAGGGIMLCLYFTLWMSWYPRRQTQVVRL